MTRTLRLLAPLLVALLAAGVPLGLASGVPAALAVEDRDGSDPAELASGHRGHLELAEAFSGIEEEREDEEAESALPPSEFVVQVVRPVRRATRGPDALQRDEVHAGTRRSRAPPSREA